MKIYLLLAALLSACATAPVSPMAPIITIPPTPTSTSTSTSVSISSIAIPDPAIINAAVVGSQCSKYAFGNRGPAPLGYLKAIATAYARALCFYNGPSHTYAGTIGGPITTDTKDALAHYGFTTATGGQRVKNTYTLLLGLGLRESSGQFGTGWDRSKLKDSPPIQPTAINSETGAFQVSYDNNSKMPASAALYLDYVANPAFCGTAYQSGAIPQDFVGTGPGYDFQHFVRYCPMLQADYAAAGIRVNRLQWGPLNRKEAEYYQPCEDMLSKIEVAITCK